MVWRLVGQGLSNGDIAAALSFSERSVRYWVSTLEAKLGAQVRTQLVAMAYQSGVIIPEHAQARTPEQRWRR